MSREHVRSWVGEAATSVALTLLGLAFVAGARRLGLFEDGIPGPGMAPAILGLALAALGIGLTIAAVVRRAGELVAVLDRDALAAIGMMFVVVVSFETFGYLISAFWFLMAAFVLIGREPWLPSALIAASATLLSCALFVKALGVGLPAGLLAPL